MEVLADINAESAVLAGITKYKDAYFDVCDILNEATFLDKTNQILYKCIKHIFEKDGKPDLPSIYSAAKELNLDYVFKKEKVEKQAAALFTTFVELPNVRKFAAKIRKLQIARLLNEQLANAQNKVLEVDGTESVNSILGIAENAILDFSGLINDVDDNPKLVSDGIEDHIDYLLSNPVDSVGLSTGMTRWDQAIGGGLRKGTINVIGARAKAGKSSISINAALKISLDVPVLILDNEMSEKDQKNRMLANLSSLNITEVEKGKFYSSGGDLKLKRAAKELSKRKIYFKSIAGVSLEDQLSIARRWLMKEVGLNEDGTAKDCLIIYDQMQITDEKSMSGNIQEYQAVGFLILHLHNFAVKFQLPIFALIQLNRDGVDKESVAAVAQSDRVIWRCSNFSIFKSKSDEEIAQDGPENGNRKLLPLVCRHGPGLPEKCYINLHMNGGQAKITEGLTNFEIKQGVKLNDNNVFASEDIGEVEFGGDEPPVF